MQVQLSTARDVAAAAFILAALALPVLIPLPGSDAARMQVRFRTGEMTTAKDFSTVTSLSACTVMAAALSFEDRDTGEYTRVACAE